MASFFKLGDCFPRDCFFTVTGHKCVSPGLLAIAPSL